MIGFVPTADDASEARRRLERSAADLVGQRIPGVTYWDLAHSGPESRAWDYGDWHHAVMGVELQVESGPVCVLWTDTFYTYGVEIFSEPISNFLRLGAEGPEGWGVEDHEFWRARTGSPVLGSALFWERFEVGPGYRLSDNARVSEPASCDVPVALRIDFAAGPVWMVAAQPGEPDVDNVFVGGDEIMVVFSAERMRTIGFPQTDFLTTPGSPA